ncbi:MAG TPA: extracellular solute-binding protein [Mobilitalea sp.]|nr:extracellular solute-binding protein [Mobilitalea sp.]
MKKKKKKQIYAILAVIVLVASFIYISSKSGNITTVKASGPVEEYYEASYQEYLDQNDFDGTLSSSEVPVDLANYTTSEGMTATQDDQGVSTTELGKITWSFDVAQAGFYNIEIGYIPLKGTNSQIKRVLYIDDQICYNGLKQIVFNRMFTDASTTIEVKNHNEIRPKSIEIMEEQTVYIDDSQKRSSDPYKFYFAPGKHTITFESIKESMKITGITLKSMPKILSYEETIAGLKSQYNTYSGDNIVCQAERTDANTTKIIRSSTAITIKNNVSDPNLQPYHPYYIEYNTIGGDSWKYPGDVITWEVNVPEEGLYRISLKGSQNIKRGVTSYRKIRINGEIPFLEAQSLRFDYSTDMTNYILGDGTKDGAYLLHLKKGMNTISLEVVLGEFGKTYTQVSESVFDLNELYRKVVQITGTAPDKYIDYEITKKLPDFVTTVKAEQEQLQSVYDSLLAITGEKGENAVLVEKMLIQLKELEQNPEKAALAGELSTFKSNITSMATWLIQIGEMPLELDSITLFAADQEPAQAKAGFFKQLYNDTIRFFATFFVDNTKVYTEDTVKKDSIKVWIPTGRDQAQLLRELIDQSFTPQYNIGVDLELVPIDVVIPSTLAGVGPDVVLSIDQTRLMDFAMRNSLVDLSTLDGYAEESTKYFPSAIEGITYQGGVYGLPETQVFGMLFYRKDIFDALGLQPPKTWQDFKEIIPVLSMYNYEAWIPTTAPLSSMIFQRGGNLYLGEGKDYGIESGLSQRCAMDAFTELTDFFTAYKLPVSVDFANRFRTGEVPIGIADYTEYNKFELLAPEIKGLWSFAPIPGTEQPDRSIDNTVACTTTQCVMLKSAQNKGVVDAAWTFMRWWMSTEVQTEYANSIEAILGASARYPTANKEVLLQLPWSTKDAQTLLEQFEHTRGIPPVPGHYMTTRMLDYTFKDVVSSGANPSETLYLNIKAINQELTKKRKEFGLSTAK